MRYVTYIYGGNEFAGVESDGRVYSFGSLLGEDISVLEFIRRCEKNEVPDFILKDNGIPIGEVRLLAPIPFPMRNIFCIGKNYVEHAREVKETIQGNQGDDLIPKSPIYFTKTAMPAIGDGGIIPLHSHITKQVDYEAELGVVIGKELSCATREQVAGAIFGYTIINDVTARDLQKKHSQWFFGKSLDGFCAIGPCIVSAGDIGFPPVLDIKCYVNGELRQSSCTDKLIFDIPHILAELSQGITLRAGDIIATGTPAGVGHAMVPPRYLKQGDEVVCEIEGIGVLRNFF